MATVEITKENFEEAVSDNAFVVFDFWASWCPPCRAFAPIFERASARHTDVLFGKIDTEAQPELSAAFEVSSIPTVMVVREQAIVHQQPGMMSAEQLDSLLDQARALDMANLRAQAAEQGAAE